MATLVLTAIGDDKSGLVDALSGVVSDHGGTWEKSHMARLAGKFAGIVMVTVPDQNVDPFIADLEPLEAQGLLEIAIERAEGEQEPESPRYTMELFGVDHPGIVHEVSHALAERKINIEELITETESAAMGGGTVFRAHATLRVPPDVSIPELEDSLHRLADQLAVDIEIHPDPDG